MRLVPLELLDTAVSGTVARVLSMVIACTHRCIPGLRPSAVSALSVSRLWFELYYAAVSGAAAPARAAHVVYAVGYSLGGGIRLGCWIRWYPLFLLGCCFELYDAAVSGTAVFAMSADCDPHAVVHSLCGGGFVSAKSWTFFFIYVYLFYLFSRTTPHGIVVLVLTTILKYKRTWYHLLQYESEYIRELHTAVSSFSLWLLFKFCCCLELYSAAVSGTAVPTRPLSLLIECTRRCTLVKLLDTAVPAPSLGLLF